MKKLMLLGGIRYLIPVIKKAQKMGIYVITCDNIPGNIAHMYSDEHYYINITDKEAVLQWAQKLNIDGILSFACDPGVVTAAYVAEKMGLPFQGSYKSVTILQNKGLFREFLATHNFNVPHFKKYTDPQKPYKDINYFSWPVIVKPVDSAGSKGVTRVNSPNQLQNAIQRALQQSMSGAFIIEDFLTFKGYHSSTDAFVINKELIFITYSDQLFDAGAPNPYTPSMIIWPTSMDKKYQDILTQETNRLIELLDLTTGIYNIETCVGKNGKPYIMELSPRGGGCKIAEIQQLAFGIDLIENEIRKAVNIPVQALDPENCNEYWCEMIIHTCSDQSGILKKISVEPDIEKKYVQLIDIQAKAGDTINPFTGANMSLGDIFLRFQSRNELDAIMSISKEWLTIELTEIP